MENVISGAKRLATRIGKLEQQYGIGDQGVKERQENILKRGHALAKRVGVLENESGSVTDIVRQKQINVIKRAQALSDRVSKLEGGSSQDTTTFRAPSFLRSTNNSGKIAGYEWKKQGALGTGYYLMDENKSYA
eukprot:UN25132